MSLSRNWNEMAYLICWKKREDRDDLSNKRRTSSTNRDRRGPVQAQSPQKRMKLRLTCMWFCQTWNTSSIRRAKKCKDSLSNSRRKMSILGSFWLRTSISSKSFKTVQLNFSRHKIATKSLKNSSAYFTNKKKTFLTALKAKLTKLNYSRMNLFRRGLAHRTWEAVLQARWLNKLNNPSKSSALLQPKTSPPNTPRAIPK